MKKRGWKNKMKKISIPLSVIALYLIVISISNSLMAQAPATTNTGVLYVGSGGVVSTYGSFTNTAAGNTQNEGDFYLKGDWTNNGTFASNAGKVTFWGTSIQNISGSVNTGFFNATVNNASGVVLAQTITTAGTLSLTSGNVTTNSNEVSVINSSVGAIWPYSSASYVVGHLRRAVDASGSYYYPLGTAINYELANISLSSQTGFSNILGTFVNTIPNPTPLPDGLNVNGRPITDMLNYGYWTLTPNSSITGGSYVVTLNEAGATNMVGSASSYCVIKRHDSSVDWQSIGTHNDNTQAVNGGVVTAVRSDLASFSDYGIGFTGSILLPIEMLSFNAKFNTAKKAVDITWATATEQNCDYFTIERSADAVNFTDLMKVKGSGTSTINLNYATVDEHPLHGVSYYRLKQNDFDEQYKYTQIDNVNYPIDADVSFVPMPNPTTSDNLNISIKGVTGSKLKVKLMDMLGRVYFESDVYPDGDNYNFKMNPSTALAAGCYFAEVNYNGKIYSNKVVVQ